MTERSIVTARAAVLIYDESAKRWVPGGNSSGLSDVHIYHHTLRNTYRVVARKLLDREVVINSPVWRNLDYHQAKSTFHSWRDKRQIYGLNFATIDDAENFAAAMLKSIETLTLDPRQHPPPPVNHQKGEHGVDGTKLAVALRSAASRKEQRTEEKDAGGDTSPDQSRKMKKKQRPATGRRSSSKNNIFEDLEEQEDDEQWAETEETWQNSSKQKNNANTKGWEPSRSGGIRRSQSLNVQEIYSSEQSDDDDAEVGDTSSNADLESLINDLFVDMRKELTKAKNEIIRAIK